MWAFGSSRTAQEKGLCMFTDAVHMAYMDWVLIVYHNMVAKLGHVDSKGISSVSEVTRLSFRTLGFHHDSVPWGDLVEPLRGGQHQRQAESERGDAGTPQSSTARLCTRRGDARTPQGYADRLGSDSGASGRRPRLRYSRSHHCG